MEDQYQDHQDEEADEVEIDLEMQEVIEPPTQRKCTKYEIHVKCTPHLHAFFIRTSKSRIRPGCS